MCVSEEAGRFSRWRWKVDTRATYIGLGVSPLGWDEVCGGDYLRKSVGTSRTLGDGVRVTSFPYSLMFLVRWDRMALL